MTVRLVARREWWTGVLFAAGSLCFAVASFASQWASVPRPAIGVTFFVGSIVFTLAAYLQLPRASRGRDRVAAFVQLAGTLFFNVSTFAGCSTGSTRANRPARVEPRRVRLRLLPRGRA